MHFYKNILLIAGTGRNSGKTSLACAIIQKFSPQFPVIGVKVSPHFHGKSERLKILKVDSDFNLYQETLIISNKDTSRMLKSGAQKVFYIETKDHNLRNAFEDLLEYIPENIPVVCESPALAKIINPGIFLITDHDLIPAKKKDILQMKTSADIIFDINKDSLDELLSSIAFTSKGWTYREH
jgi:hypothetical protein